MISRRGAKYLGTDSKLVKGLYFNYGVRNHCGRVGTNLRHLTNVKCFIGPRTHQKEQDTIEQNQSGSVTKFFRNSSYHLCFLFWKGNHISFKFDSSPACDIFPFYKISLKRRSRKNKSGSRCPYVPNDKFQSHVKEFMTALQSNAKNKLKSGFRATGIHPLNRNKVLKRLPKAVLEESL